MKNKKNTKTQAHNTNAVQAVSEPLEVKQGLDLGNTTKKKTKNSHLYIEVKEFISLLEGLTSISTKQSKELNKLYNTVFKKGESGLTCSSCISRWRDMLKQWLIKVDIEESI